MEWQKRDSQGVPEAYLDNVPLGTDPNGISLDQHIGGLLTIQRAAPTNLTINQPIPTANSSQLHAGFNDYNVNAAANRIAELTAAAMITTATAAHNTTANAATATIKLCQTTTAPKTAPTITTAYHDPTKGNLPR